MKAIKLQTFFLVFCIFLSFRAQMGFAMQIKTVENPQADILTNKNNLSDRKLATQLTCTPLNCPSQSGSLTDQSSSYDYSVSMNPNTKITFSFTVGSDQTTLGLILSANPSANMQTNIKLNPDSSYPGNYVNPVQGANWAADLTIGSASSSRTLIISIENDDSVQTTIAKFQILVENIESSSSKTWMPPVFTIIGAGLIIFCVLGICCRIRRRRLFRRRMRAQAAYEVAMRQYDVEYNQPINPRPQSQQNQRNQHNQAAQRAQAPAQNNQQDYPLAPSVEVLNADPNGRPLSKENLDQRFPERANKMFKSSFPQSTCSICLENLGKNEKCRQLYCEHIFHSECVKLWLLNQVEKQKNCFCPNCNKKMTYVIDNAKQSS